MAVSTTSYRCFSTINLASVRTPVIDWRRLAIKLPSGNGAGGAAFSRGGTSMRSWVLAAWVVISMPALAFDHIGNGFASTWADNHEVGTPAVVTWGFMPEGTAVDPAFRMDSFGFPDQTGLAGTSSVSLLRHRIDIDQGHGLGAFDAALVRAMETWSAVANITFVGPVADVGLPFASVGADAPDIRIGAFLPEEGHSFMYTGAVGFGPPGFTDSDPLAGDIIFNLSAVFDIVAGTEDVTPLPAFTNDLEGLMLHELGHAAIGLAHPTWDGENPDQRVMYVGEFGNPAAPDCCLTVNRQLHADDIAGAQFVYGVRGDFNGDGAASLADYTLWRDHLGGAHSPADYDDWKRNFGNVRPTSEGPLASGARGVAEPVGWLNGLAAMAMLVAVAKSRAHHSR